MADAPRNRATLTVKKPSPPGPVAAALTDATSPPSPFDQAVPAHRSVAAILAGGRISALGYFFGSPAAAAQIDVNANPTHEESSDVVRSE